MQLPPINQRVHSLIEQHAFGNIKQFAQLCQMESSQKLSRLFRPNYPTPSIDIVLKIANTFSVDLNWLLLGHPEPPQNPLEKKLDLLLNQHQDILEILNKPK